MSNNLKVGENSLGVAKRKLTKRSSATQLADALMSSIKRPGTDHSTASLKQLKTQKIHLSELKLTPDRKKIKNEPSLLTGLKQNQSTKAIVFRPIQFYSMSSLK